MASKHAQFEPVLHFIEDYERFAIFTHLTPDGDALGSAYALCIMLRAMRKQAIAVLLEPPPWKYVLPEFEGLYTVLSSFDPESVQACISVDCADFKRLAQAGEVFSSRPTLSIDHHASNDRYADVNYIEESPATAQVIYELYTAAEMPVPLDAAAAIYMGIIADTGNLSYPSTTPETFRICADMAAEGLDTSTIAERLFNTRSLAATKLIGIFIRNMQLFADDRIAVSYLARATLGSIGAKPADTEALINYARDIETVEVAVFLREVAIDAYKVSLRSKGNINVSDFAAQFGGGGHARAAGCMLHGKRSDLIEDLTHRLEGLLA